MALEIATLIHQLDPANPAGPDRLSSGDDHIRMVKLALKNTFPNINAPVTVTDEFLNNTILAALVPFGIIQLWYGTAATIPAGYALCDGSIAAKSDGSGNITTPDMRGRVPVGASAARATGVTFGQDSRTVTSDGGGSHSHVGSTGAAGGHTHALTVDATALTIDQMPAHTHTVSSGGGGAGGIEGGSGGTNISSTSGSTGGGAGHTHTAAASSVTDHSHTISVDAVPAHNHAVTVEIVQSSIALHYIMKV